MTSNLGSDIIRDRMEMLNNEMPGGARKTGERDLQPAEEITAT